MSPYGNRRWRSAALETSNAAHARYFWGGPASFTLERSLDGELPADAWEDLATEVADSLNGTAPPTRVGDLLEGQDASTRVRIRSDQGRTRIAIRSKYGSCTYPARGAASRDCSASGSTGLVRW